MALLKKILKNSPREVTVKWTGSGTDTLVLTTIASTGQTTAEAVAPGVDIVAMTVNTSGACTITRNSEVALSTTGSYEYYYDDIHGVINENSGSDIVVTLASEGTLFLRLNKKQGYSPAPL